MHKPLLIPNAMMGVLWKAVCSETGLYRFGKGVTKKGHENFIWYLVGTLLHSEGAGEAAMPLRLPDWRSCWDMRSLENPPSRPFIVVLPPLPSLSCAVRQIPPAPSRHSQLETPAQPESLLERRHFLSRKMAQTEKQMS